MPTPGEHKTVQARILEYADAIGWTIVPRQEAEKRRGFEPQMTQRSADPEPQKGGSLAKSVGENGGIRVVTAIHYPPRLRRS
jgi:hypothetical protein